MKLLVVFVLLALPALAHADAKYKRKQDLHIDVTLSDRTHPIAPPTATPAKPRVTADDILRVEERTQSMRLEQEEILAKLIADTPDSDPDKPEMMFRLAEHYAKQLRFWKLTSTDAAIKAQRLP